MARPAGDVTDQEREQQYENDKEADGAKDLDLPDMHRFFIQREWYIRHSRRRHSPNFVFHDKKAATSAPTTDQPTEGDETNSSNSDVKLYRVIRSSKGSYP